MKTANVQHHMVQNEYRWEISDDRDVTAFMGALRVNGLVDNLLQLRLPGQEQLLDETTAALTFAGMILDEGLGNAWVLSSGQTELLATIAHRVVERLGYSLPNSTVPPLLGPITPDDAHINEVYHAGARFIATAGRSQ